MNQLYVYIYPVLLEPLPTHPEHESFKQIIEPEYMVLGSPLEMAAGVRRESNLVHYAF